MFFIFYDRDLPDRIIIDTDPVIFGKRAFEERIDIFSLDFDFDIPVVQIPGETCHIQLIRQHHEFPAETDALDPAFINDIITFHTLIVI